ncbi:MAG: hypothetical protein WBJ35_06235 [Acetomicrobium sp.]
MTPKTLQGWRKQLQKALDQKIPDAVWKRVIERGYIDIANQEEELETGEGLEYLKEQIQELMEDYEAFSSSPKLPAPKKQGKDSPPVEIKPNRRFEALTDIIATLVNRDEDVQKFRDEVLGGKLLLPEEVPEWIKAQKARESHTLSISIAVTAGEGLESRISEKVKQILNAIEEGQNWFLYVDKTSGYTLNYIVPGKKHMGAIPINKDGILGQLKRLAGSFKDFWPEAWAVHFILTGEVRPVSIGTITFRQTSRALKIILELSPYLTGKEVQELYFRERKALLKMATGKTKVRELTDKHIDLAVFGVKESGSWTKKMHKWNARHPECKYTNKGTFARDVRAAYERITGWKWKTRQRRRKAWIGTGN